MRHNGMDRLASVISQKQCAWKGLVVRVVGDNLTIRHYLGSCIWIYPALEHTLEGMAGEMQSFTVHTISGIKELRGLVRIKFAPRSQLSMTHPADHSLCSHQFGALYLRRTRLACLPQVIGALFCQPQTGFAATLHT